MIYEDIVFVIRAGLGRNEWTLLISFPAKAEPSVSQASGSRGDAIATAHKRIEVGCDANVKGARDLPNLGAEMKGPAAVRAVHFFIHLYCATSHLLISMPMDMLTLRYRMGRFTLSGSNLLSDLTVPCRFG